ncbi:30S ribosomal protein S13 [Candidatus Vidania fulgoroideae]|nr:30S ribosomal protein S13 [Candidatus Vidania fulgoroideae]
MIFEGVNLSENKYVYVSIRKIFGIGKKNSLIICKKLNITNKKILHLNTKEKKNLYKQLRKYIVEGNLKTKIYNNIQKLIDIHSYRGTRHSKFLPSRGQRTKTNSKTRKKKKVLFFIKNV